VQPLLKKEAVLLIKGRIRRDEASAKPKVIVSEVHPLEKAGGNGRKSIRVRIRLDSVPETLLESMYSLLASHPGNDALVFHLVREGNFRATLRPRRPAGVKADEDLLTELRRICGDDAVSVEQRT